MMSRRAFLTTIAASAAVAAVYDPKTLLWTPDTRLTDIVLADAKQLEEIEELNDLARRVARGMSEHLEMHPAIGLREVVYRHTGGVDLPKGLMGLFGVGPGHFNPMQRHMLTTGAHSDKDRVREAVWSLSTFVKNKRIDMFAPVSMEISPGNPFSKDILIGRATDPETGLSVRALRWKQVAGGFGDQMLTGFEIAGGRWVPPHISSKKLATLTALCALSTFGDEA